MATRVQKAANRWVARIIPAILVGIIGYSAYVITKVVAIDYFINPSPELLVQPRPGSAVAILLFYYLLVIPLLVCYARLIQTIITDPGYVERGPAWYQKSHEEAARNPQHCRGYYKRRRTTPNFAEKASEPLQLWPPNNPNRKSSGSNHSSLTPAIEHARNDSFSRNRSIDIPFWHRDIFVCNPDGRPRFCSTCLVHKPDRTHHCSEVDRCVRKMDHFCPWVGGIISETSFKFFIQFLVHAVMFCTMVLTTIAVFIAERRRMDGGFLNVHAFLILGLSALFLLFSLGMAVSSIQLAFINSTTVENLNRRTQVWFLAVLIPRTEDGRLPSLPHPSSSPRRGAAAPHFQTITYPRPAGEDQFLINQARGAQANHFIPPHLTTDCSTVTTLPSPPRTFAILSTKPGENPFDLGSWQNICQVMGYSILEWILPIKSSPCTDHTSRISLFRMNERLIRRLKVEAGLVEGRRSVGRGVGRAKGISRGDESEEGAKDDYGNRRKKRWRMKQNGTGTDRTDGETASQ